MTEKIVMGIIYVFFVSGVVLILQSDLDTGLGGRLERRVIAKQIQEKKETLSERFLSLPIVQSMKTEKIEREIYESLSYMRNLIAAHKEGINSDSMIGGLAEQDGILQETYFRMLSLMRTGRIGEAQKVMEEATGGTEIGREFASLLLTWEELEPERLSQIIGSYRRSIRETCITRQKKRDELISDFIYFPATANVFLIFINFIYISYFMEQKEMLQFLF